MYSNGFSQVNILINFIYKFIFIKYIQKFFFKINNNIKDKT